MSNCLDCTPIDGSYATLQDLGEAGIPAQALSGVPFTAQQNALIRASRMADTWLRARYNLPIAAPYDPALVDAVCQIAAWRLLTLRGFNPSNPSDPVVRQGYDDAITWLKDIANGRANLCVTQTVPGSLQPQVTTDGERGYETHPELIGPNNVGF